MQGYNLWMVTAVSVFWLFEVNVILRLTHLPPFPEYTLDLSAFPHGYGSLRPVSMEGLVVAMTRVTKYTQGARFLCTDDDCPCSKGTVTQRAAGKRRILLYCRALL